jgi:hypothetical protein
MTEHDPVPWDQSEAIDRIAKACIAGDLDAATLGWRRLTEAGTNASYAKFARSAIELRQLRIEREADVEVHHEEVANMEHNLGLVISTVEVEQGEIGRHDVKIALADVLLGELAHTVKLLSLELRALKARVKALEAEG